MAETAKWYVVHTYSGYENTVMATIEKTVETRQLQDIIQQVSIPMETVTEVTEKGPKTYDRKVFPGYVLVKMVMTDDAWYIIKNVRGVTGFVTSGSTKPTPLTEDEVIQLGVEKREIVVGYKVGDTVRIMDGPLTSFSGIVEELDVEKNRFHVRPRNAGRSGARSGGALHRLIRAKRGRGSPPPEIRVSVLPHSIWRCLSWHRKLLVISNFRFRPPRRPLRPLSARLSASMALISHSLSASSTTAPRIRPVLRSPS